MAMRLMKSCAGGEDDTEEDYEDKVAEPNNLKATVRRMGGRFSDLRNISDARSVISKNTTTSRKTFLPTNTYTKSEIEGDMKDALEILNANRKAGTLAIGTDNMVQNMKNVQRRIKAIEYSGKLLHVQHCMFTVPKNCNNIEKRTRNFIFKNVDLAAPFFASDPVDNMFLSHDKYAQGTIAWSSDTLGDLENVYICQIHICHVQNNTNSTFGFRFMIDKERSEAQANLKSGVVLPGDNTYGKWKDPSSGVERLEPFHFIIPANRTTVKEESVYTNTYQGNDLSEKFPYLTASKESIVQGTTKSPNSNMYIVPGAHPICYWLICNHRKFTKLTLPKQEGKNYEVPAAQYDFAVEKIMETMKHVSIVDMTTLKLQMMRIDSPPTTNKKVEDDKYQTISLNVEVTYLFREHKVNVATGDEDEEDDDDEDDDENGDFEDEYDLSD
jgi:hypothetical protein